MKWETITEEEFKKLFIRAGFIRHTVMICDPEITYFWSNDWFTTDGLADYDKSVGRVIHDDSRIFQKAVQS